MQADEGIVCDAVVGEWGEREALEESGEDGGGEVLGVGAELDEAAKVGYEGGGVGAYGSWGGGLVCACW